MAVVGRCHRLADRLDSHTSPDVAAVAAEVRRMASILAGGLMDHARRLDRADARHRHDDEDDEDDDGAAHGQGVSDRVRFGQVETGFRRGHLT